MAVHAKGKISFTDDAGTYTMIKDITDKYTGTGHAASFDQLDQGYINQMLKAIVGFNIEVESIESVFKLSQNKSEQDQQNIIRELEKSNEHNALVIATAMKNRLS